MSLATLNSEPVEPLVSWRPAAAAIGCDRKAFWRAVHEGGLPMYRINTRVIRFRISEVQRWLQTRRVGAL